VVVAPDIQRHVTAIESQSCFKIRAFDKRAAIEIALRVKRSRKLETRKKASEQRGIRLSTTSDVAVAKVEGVSEIVSMDRDIHQHGKLWGIAVRNVRSCPFPYQGKLP